ncbi:hypothetical protein CJ030_MR7G016939 [Morella rubra]|uniref:Reverse transcriptase zinc-binding domain-containing protein n=1 Tax=Morella rubra TaxID=262757 RepID=A0A6A1UZY6_9ROSI|nr:hypothetical protein CJ030_MR7G016939 [Morella rubra]
MEERFWKKLLKSKIQDQLKLMLWKLASNSLLVRGKMGFLRTNSEDVLNHCLIYNIETESVEHLFLQCKISQILWQHGPWPLNIEVYAQLNIEDWFHIILNPKQSLGLPDSQYQNFILFVALLLDGVWFLRNKVVHNEGNPEPTIRIHDLQRRCAEHTFTWVAHTATVSNSWQPPWCEMEPSDLSSADVTTLWKIMDDHPRWSLTWIPRSQNQLAHLIAK